MTEPRILGGRYQLGRVIGRGGMAVVSQARDLRLGREVAIKELRTDLAGDATFQARFRREAQAAAGLNHPNIVSVYDTGEETDPQSQVGVPYIVMELVEGRTLRDILRDGRQILPRRALEFTVGVLEALHFSHKAGIIHRDIKPANVMLTNQGTVKVMDFGIARAVSDTSSTMTQTAAVIGTAQYLSPEQARGETVDSRSDIYSAGCLMYELLVGRPPFVGDSPVSVAYQHVREQPVPPSQLDAEITTAMDAVVLKALAKNPDDRYATAGEMRDDVRRILGGERVEATLPPPVPPLVAAAPGETALMAEQTGTLATGSFAPVPPERKSRAGLWWTLAVVSLLLVGLVAGIFLLNRQEPKAKEVQVPSGLINQPVVVAESLVREAKLTPVVVNRELNDTATIGKVIETDPLAGTSVPEGSNVTLTVNVGPKQLVIPNGLEGKTFDQAAKILKDAGFLDVRPVDATDEPADAKVGTVVSVTPASGSRATAGSTVTLSVATGKGRVPYLIGLQQDEAVAKAQELGFTKVQVEKRVVAGSQPGVVVETRPEDGQVVNRSDTLVIVVAAAAPTAAPTTSTTPSPTKSSTAPSPSASSSTSAPAPSASASSSAAPGPSASASPTSTTP